MEKRNPMLKKAFEEAAKREIESLPEENMIVRPYSEEHSKKMDILLEQRNDAIKNRKTFSRIAAIAVSAVLMCIMVIGASGSMWDLIDFSNFDPDNYTYSEWVIDDSFITGEDADEYYEVYYTGKPITIRYSLDTGINSEFPERALVILVNGVRQTFNATLGDKKYKDITILELERGLGTVQMAELTFEPNIGEKGEVMALEVASIFDPDQNFYSKCKGVNGILDVHEDFDHDDICDLCEINITEIPSGPRSLTFGNEAFAKIIMKKASSDSEENICEEFSGYVVSDLHKKIYERFNYEVPGSDPIEYYNEYDRVESMCAVFYQDIDKNLTYDAGGGILSDTIFRTAPKENDIFTINLHGRSGEYRVAFYIGVEPQSVFDGKDYVDVKIEDGKQVELNISLDTTNLEKENKFYIVYKHIGDNLFEPFWWHSEQICEGTIIVE